MVWLTTGELLIQTNDRWTSAVWRIDPQTWTSSRIDTQGLLIGSFGATPTGSTVFYEGSSGHFTGRVFEFSNNKTSTLLDMNPQLADLLLGDQRRISWINSKGDTVDGVIILPPGYVPGRRYALIVDAYPTHGRDEFKLTPTSQSMGQLESAHGYVVFSPRVRAPHNNYDFPRDRAYTEKGIGEPGVELSVDDIESGISYLSKQGIIDPDRVGVYGHSNGGYEANILITHSRSFRCAVIDAGMNNLFPGIWGFIPAQLSKTNGSNIFEDPTPTIAGSPILRMDKVNIPVLLFSGDLDVDWSVQTVGEFNTLRMLHKDVTWRHYRDEGHAFVTDLAIQDSLDHTIAFFDRCLKSNHVDGIPDH